MYTAEIYRRLLVLLTANLLLKTTKDPVTMQFAIMGTLPKY